MRLQGFRPAQDIVIVALDDISIQEFGGWPLQRSKYATLLNQLADECCRPKSIGFDLLFLDSTNDDAELATQLKKHNSVLPLAFQSSDKLPYRLQATPPVEPLSEAATLAHINLTFDSDGVIRGFQESEQTWLHFSIAMQGSSDQVEAPRTTEKYKRFRMVDPNIGFPVISLVDAIHSKAHRTLLKNKYVLIGATAPSLGDRYPTLYSGQNNTSTPGVSILASILNASLNQEMIRVSPPLIVFAVTIFPLLFMLRSLLVLPPRYILLLTCGLCVGAIFACYILLSLMNYWVDPTPLIGISLLLQLFWIWRRLEAIVDFVQSKAAYLKQSQHRSERSLTAPTSREVVLQHAKQLDQAVSATQSELNFLASIIDEMPDSVMIFDANDHLLLCSQKAKQLFSSYQFLEGSNLIDFEKHINVALPTLLDNDKTVPSPELQTVVQLNTALGYRDFIVKATKLDSKTEHHFRLIILMDVTELKKSQTQRDRALQFLSHDMRTPVASILSITSSSKVPTSDIEAKITHHANTLLSMMDDFILTISSEAKHYVLQDVLLDNLINDALEEVADLANAKKILLSDQSEVAGIFVSANPRLLLRVLINLLFNAIKFSPHQSVIQIKVSNDITTHNLQQTVVITITNNIATTNIAQESPQSMQGFGLGLDFINNVIQRHHGDIEKTIPTSGIATVRITLPCQIDKNDEKSS